MSRLERARRRCTDEERSFTTARSQSERNGAAVRLAYARLAERAALPAAEPGPVSMTDVRSYIAMFGEHRAKDGDVFTASREADGYYLYETGGAKSGIAVWGDEDRWTLSVFAAARVGMQPTPELYRRAALWRSTVPMSACYVIEDGKAAVMCERSIESHQVRDDETARLMIRSSIDLMGSYACLIGGDLEDFDGVPFTASDEVGLSLLLSWWEIQDGRISAVVRESA